MLVNRKYMITAISIMAVMFIAMIFSGCATPRQINELKMEIQEVNRQNQDTQQKIDNMERVIVEGAEAATKLRNDVSSGNDYIQQQIDLLLENYNQLLYITNNIYQSVNTKKVIIGSTATPPANNIQPTVGDQQPLVDKPIQMPEVDCGLLYDSAFILLTQEEYEQAIGGFETYLGKCPNDESIENAYYWIGECYYLQDKFVDAIEKYEFLLTNYKGSIKSSQALYKLARSNQELGKVDKAKKIYKQIIDEHPETLEASQAKDILKNL